MAPDVGVVSELLRVFEDAFKGGYLDVRGYAFSLLGVLVALELTFLGLWCALGGSEVAGPFLKKLLAIGFFSWVVMQFDWLTTEVLSGFTTVGRAAAGAAGGDTKAITDPSYVISEGFRVTQALFDYAKQTNEASWVGFAADSVIALFGAVFILIAFFLIALQIFITRVEFAMLVALGLILIPFGIFKHTAFLAEKTFGAIISFGIKLMVLTFLVSVAMPLLTKYTVPENPSWDTIFNMAFVAATIMYLAWHAPSITAGLLTGGPSLSGIGLSSPVAAAGGAALGAAGALAGAALKGSVTAGASAAMTAVKAAAGAIGGSSGGGGGGDATQSASNSAAASAQGSGKGGEASGGGGASNSSSLQTARSVKESQGEGSSSSEGTSSGGSSYGGASAAKSAVSAQSPGGVSPVAAEAKERSSRSGAAEQGSKSSPETSGGGANSSTAAGSKAGKIEEAENSSNQGNSGAKSPISSGAQRGQSLNERIRHSAHRGKEAAKDMVSKAPSPVAGLSLTTLKE